MNTKIFAVLAALLVISSTSVAKADWLDDLNEGTSRLAHTVNDNTMKVNQIADSLGIIARILRQSDHSGEDGE